VAPNSEVQTADIWLLLMVRNLKYNGGIGSSAMIFIQSFMKIHQLFQDLLKWGGGGGLQTHKHTDDYKRKSI
jgi:hypothetical protein